MQSVYIVAALLALVSWALWKKSRFLRAPYPPGPKGLPLIGNLRDVPASREWLAYAAWSRQFSMFEFSVSRRVG